MCLYVGICVSARGTVVLSVGVVSAIRYRCVVGRRLLVQQNYQRRSVRLIRYCTLLVVVVTFLARANAFLVRHTSTY